MIKGEERISLPPAGAPVGKIAPPVPRNIWLALALVILLGLGLRLYQLGAEGLIPDEGISVQRVRDFHWDYLRPLYFVVLWLWIHLGDSEATLRLPAALMGTATIPLVYLLGQRLFTPRAGLIAALFVAVSPLHLNHSQEVRMYSQMTLFAAASFYFFWLLVEEGKARNFVAYALTTLAALLTQPVSIFLLAAQNVHLLVWCRRHRRLATWWLVVQGVIAVAALPFIREMAVQIPAFAQDWVSIHEAPGLRDVIQLISEFSFWKRSLAFMQFGSAAHLAYYALFLGVLALLAAVLLRMRKRAEPVTLVITWLVVPVLCAFAISHTLVNIWQSRYLLYVLPAYALLLGFSVDELVQLPTGRFAGVLAGAVLLASLGIDALYFAEPVREDWPNTFRYLRAHRQPGDGFAVYPDQAGATFGYYFERAFGPESAAPATGAAGARAADPRRATNRDNPGAAPGRSILGMGGKDWVPLLLQPRVFRDLTSPELQRLFSQLPPERPRYWLVMTHHEHRGGDSIKHYVEEHYEVLERPTFQYLEVLLFRPRRGSRG